MAFAGELSSRLESSDLEPLLIDTLRNRLRWILTGMTCLVLDVEDLITLQDLDCPLEAALEKRVNLHASND